MISEGAGKAVELSRLFIHQTQWSNLRSLQLQGFFTSEVDLKRLLTAHANSLKSLGLARMILKSYESKGKLHYSSWADVILFLRESLNLHDMRFKDYLVTEGCENWRIQEPVMAYVQGTPPVRESLKFRNRVENYVLEGGEFPLPWPARKEQSLWRDLLKDFRPKLDETWEYHEDARWVWRHN